MAPSLPAVHMPDNRDAFGALLSVREGVCLYVCLCVCSLFSISLRFIRLLVFSILPMFLFDVSCSLIHYVLHVPIPRILLV
ncbi:hypothetical protein B484DRAFT_458880 [Ochromonadaceae sp. CCMP2298]|nr:hypothetical protein B484DRAFT_458880 [Ochromonadaceae sp. CCMP2298]